MKKIWYVYIMQCADHTYYTGITNDLAKRLATHNNGTGAKYTRARLPVILIFSEKVFDKSAALRREIEIKKMSHLQKHNLSKFNANLN